MSENQDQLQKDFAIDRAVALNYRGKKLDSSRAAVVQVIYDEMLEQWQQVGFNKDDLTSFIESWAATMKATGAASKKVVKVDNRPISAGSLTIAESSREVLTGKRFLVTSAQNNTDVHLPFLRALENYATEINAQIIVFPFLYNKNGFQNGEGQDDIHYDPAIVKYMRSESAWLGDECKVTALAFNILPTVKNPLSGMREAIGSAEALIVPHATIAHENIPVLGAQHGRVVPAMYSTGTVTQRNYIQQQAGHKAENRHNFGALIVEINDKGQFWIRQIETDETGEFYDMRNWISTNGVLCGFDTVDVINYGDIHAEKIDDNCASSLFANYNNSLLDYLKPQYQMMHDLLDFSALNHHNRENHYHIAKNHYAQESVTNDLEHVVGVLEACSRDWCKTVVVRSNHDDALDRWLADSKYEPRKDPVNALAYYSLQVEAYKAIEDNRDFDSLPTALRLLTSIDIDVANIQFLRIGESFMVNGVELGEHGHGGINGSRGSPKQFAASKCTTGHTHSSSIYGGCYTAGVTGKLNMGYNELGASSWVQSSVIQYKNGKRAIIHVKDDGAGTLDYRAR